MSPSSNRFDVHQEITNRIVGALETAGEFRLPWIASGAGALSRPVNVLSGNAYNGVNVLSLWVSAMVSEFSSPIWGTYRQWQEKGCQVRKGEKSSVVVFYKTYEIDSDGESPEERMVARASRVFNAAQVEGFDAVAEELPSGPVFDPVARAEAFVGSVGARVVEDGEEACYVPSEDLIRMPERRRFVGSDSRSAGEAFYGVLCHELVHWSGAKSRLDRDLSGRFGNEAYAMEELIAELGAAFLCADLGLCSSPRNDHAAYIRTWLQVLKSDKKAVFTAASRASEAAGWLLAQEGAP